MCTKKTACDCCSEEKLIWQEFTVTCVPLTPEEAPYPVPPFDDKELDFLTQLVDAVTNHSDRLKKTKRKIIASLEKLRAKYPEFPTIINHMMMVYQYVGDHAAYNALVDELYEKFPDYLFARIAMARKCFSENNIEKFHEIFHGNYTLKSLYPNRSVFHVAECCAFELCMVEYFCKIGCVEQAMAHYDILAEFLDDYDLPLIEARGMIEATIELLNESTHED